MEELFCFSSNGSMNLLYLHDTCLIHFYYTAFHVAFTVLLIFTQGISYCQAKEQRQFLHKHQGHDIRWIFSILLLLIQIVATAEGILTNSTCTSEDAFTYLHLYVPSICAFFGGVCAIILCHYMEVWHTQWPSFILTTYWTFSCVAEIARIVNLIQIDVVSISILHFDITVVLLCIYGTLVVVQLNQIRTRNYTSLQSHVSTIRHNHDSKQNMFFLREYVSFPSHVLHCWLSWLLRLGYRKPLTIEDLGCLPKAHLAAPNHQRLRKAVQAELSSTFYGGKKTSLLKVFWKLSWKVLLTSGLLRCFGEPFVLVTPFAISGIISYVNVLDTEPKHQAIKDTNLPVDRLLNVEVRADSRSFSMLPWLQRDFAGAWHAGTSCPGRMDAHELFYVNHPCSRSNPCLFDQYLPPRGQVHREKPGQETFHFISLQDFLTDGFVLLVTIFVANIIERLCLWTSQYMLVVESLHIKVAIQAAVYEKCLQIPSVMDSKGKMSIGYITNCMSTDASNVSMAMQMIHFTIIPPLTLVTLLLLFNTLGVSAVCGLAVCAVLFPIIVTTSKRISIYQKKALVFADERIKHTHEMLKEIKFIKLNAWEELFCRNIDKLRIKELHQICYKNLVFAVAAFCSNATPVMMTLVSFGTYTLLNGKPLTPEIAFPSLALFSLFDRFLFIVPVGLSTVVTGYVSTKRLETFLLTPAENKSHDSEISSGTEATSTGVLSDDKEDTSSCRYSNCTNNFKSNPKCCVELKPVVSENTYPSNSNQTESLEESVHDDMTIQLIKCNLAWGRMDMEPVLVDVDVQIESGQLTMVVGSVGSGKSALLASMLDEMVLLSGDIKFPRVKPTMAFAAQRPWIQNANLRDNILCGLPMDIQRYDAVIYGCGLEPDIALLSAGDLTEIGERGINLSGGQKQRVNVARAIYSQAQCVLLDDPLSALDGHVGTHLFESGIMGLLKRNNRTVVLVTNQLQYLQYADKIIVLDSGHVRHQGSYDMIVESDKQLFTQWGEAVTHSSIHTDHCTSEKERNMLQQQVALQRQYQHHADQQKKTGETNRLVEKEDMARGSVMASVYIYLIKASRWFLVAFFIGFGVVQALYLGKDLWLANWSETSISDPNKTTSQITYYVGGYAGISMATIFVSVASQLVHTAAALTAGITLHRVMLTNVSKLPLRFFDTNPIGRVLNRFSSDINMIDMKLFRTIDASTFSIWQIIFCFIAIILVVPLFSVVSAIVGIMYIFLQVFYLKTSRELHRLESVSKSPIYAHFSETLNGLSTIRAFGFQKRFFNTLLERIDTNSTAYLYMKTASVWLNLRLDLMGAVVVLLAGFATMIAAVSSGLSPALVALAIVYAQRASGSFGYLVKYLSDLEMQMNAVERVRHYAIQPTEDFDGVTKAPAEWPRHGVIRFQDVSVGYDKDQDPILQHVSLQFHSAEKVGICGRTGSGKSSLILALFRCNVIFKGSIYIDDINTCDLPLASLRQQLAIIPQDPTLFTGTIRNNLDPEGTKSDEELWNALNITQLKSAVTELDGGLDAAVSEGGDNFSIGQHQLFCLARAFLRKSRILVMDEATASVDTETAKILQEMITSVFADRTVLTIAHRVSSILESDRILVLNEGKVVEFDTPKNLLANKSSVFASIVLASEGHI